MSIRALIVEDEPLARRTLRDFIADFDWLTLVGEAADGIEALEKIEKLKPELIFLDVQIPEISGLEVLRRIKHKPAVVFTTAYDDYAVKAFELEALDYLQKPFGRERFRRTIERVRQRLLDSETKAPRQSAKRTDKNVESPNKVFVRQNDLIFPLDVKEIVWLQANGDYVNIYTADEKYLTNGTLSDFAGRIINDNFLQIHRSAIVNLNQIEKIEEHGRTLLLYMKNGAEVQASRSGAQALRKLIA